MSPTTHTSAAMGGTKPALVPKLRFPEFRETEGWKVKKLSSSVQLISGAHLSPDQYGKDGAVPYFTGPSDFTNNVESITKRTSDSASTAKEDDTLITVKGSGVGEIWYLTLSAVAIGRQLMAIRATDSSSRFVYQFLLTKRHRFEDLAAGNLIPGLARGEILDLEAPFPSRAEQQKIAECLSSVDELLAAQARKMDALKTHKKRLMQQLFPREGETQPGLRFPEFQNAGEWESKTLVDVCKMQAGKFVAASDIKELNAVDMFPCYGGNGLRGFTETYTHDGVYPLIGRQGALCGNVKLAKRRFHATEHAVVATPKRGIEVVYLYYLLDLLNLNRFATGQAQPGLSVDVLEKVPVTIPSDEHEQHRIATCLSSLDTLITSETQKLDTLKTHKRGLMQQLFPPPEEIAGL